MTAPKARTAIHAKSYKLGEPVPFLYVEPYPYDVYGIRKELELYGLNKYHIEFVIVEVGDRTFHSIGYQLDQFEMKTQDDVISTVSKLLGVEETREAIAKKINSIQIKYYRENHDN